MSHHHYAMDLFCQWYSSLPYQAQSGGPPKGSIAAALVVLDQLLDDFNLALESHLAPGGAQVKGVSGGAVARILARYGEKRPFAREGGRTNRGARATIESMLAAISSASLQDMPVEKRNAILQGMQQYLVERVQDYHNRERIKFIFDPTQSGWQTISSILNSARETRREGQVAQHLVGAKLQLRFPNISIENFSYSTADHQLDRPGDFKVGDTAFHVTVSPMPPVIEKCRANLSMGLRPFLLVPNRRVEVARQLADVNGIEQRLSIASIESFVANNIEEISEFTTNNLVGGFRRLIEIYNQRVNEAETDKSMMIEIPPNLIA